MMALDKPYRDVPGTVIFDADQARLGYHLNQFCMSLMKADNRVRFLADERRYLDEWPMTEAQKQAVIDRDLNRCIALGGNIRVGMEDNVVYAKNRLAKSNAEFVERAARLIREANKEVASSNDAREILNLKR